MSSREQLTGIFHQMNGTSDIQKIICQQKRKAALIGVLTLGLSSLSILGVGETWRSNIFAGTSLDHGGIGFVLKALSFVFLTALLAVPFFILSVCRLIYYSIVLKSMK